jgi:hypothetical protein
MDMPQIKMCEARDCAYNRGQQCHALAITIGDKRHPMCDTFTKSPEKAGDGDNTGRVGACRTSACQYNQDLLCSAQAIDVGAHKAKDWDCKTFEKRSKSSSMSSKKQGW